MVAAQAGKRVGQRESVGDHVGDALDALDSRVILH